MVVGSRNQLVSKSAVYIAAVVVVKAQHKQVLHQIKIAISLWDTRYILTRRILISPDPLICYYLFKHPYKLNNEIKLMYTYFPRLETSKLDYCLIM